MKYLPQIFKNNQVIIQKITVDVDSENQSLYVVIRPASAANSNTQLSSLAQSQNLKSKPFKSFFRSRGQGTI